MGDVERSYVEGIRTFRQDFSWHQDDPAVVRSVAALAAWYAELDRDLLAALEAPAEDDVTTRRIARADFDPDEFLPLPLEDLDVYREALLIFYAKASIYLRLMGRDLPGHWGHWIG